MEHGSLRFIKDPIPPQDAIKRRFNGVLVLPDKKTAARCGPPLLKQFALWPISSAARAQAWKGYTAVRPNGFEIDWLVTSQCVNCIMSEQTKAK